MNRKYKRRAKAKGICVSCLKRPVLTDYLNCEICLDYNKAYQRQLTPVQTERRRLTCTKHRKIRQANPELCNRCGHSKENDNYAECVVCRAKLFKPRDQARHPAAIPRIQKENAPKLEEFLNGFIAQEERT